MTAGRILRNEAHAEAIAQADAYTNNAGLTTYTALRKALEEIVKNDPFRQSSAGIIARRALGIE